MHQEPKPTLTKEEYARRKTAKKLRQKARAGTSSESYGSEQYWKYAKADIDNGKEINELDWVQNRRKYTSTDDPRYIRAEDAYLDQRAKLEEQHKSTIRREKEHRKRYQVLSHLKTENLVSARSAFVELFMTMMETRSRDKQDHFVKDLKRTYGAKGLGGIEHVWDVLSGTWIPRLNTKAAHIFPVSIGQPTMLYIFGPDAKGELNTARNGLFLPLLVGKQFDNHQLVIVPHGQINAKHRQWKVLVLNKSLKDAVAFGKTTFEEMDGQRLIFRSDAQPRARYLYFHFLCAMIRRSREPAKTGNHMHSNPPDVTMPELSRAWGSRGSYMRENIIWGFIEQLGHEIPEDAKERILSHSSEGIAEDEVDKGTEAIRDMELEAKYDYESEGYEDEEADDDDDTDDE